MRGPRPSNGSPTSWTSARTATFRSSFFWGGVLLGGRDTLKGVGDGVADMGTVVGFFTPRELRAYNVGDLPLESDPWIGLRAVYEMSEENEAIQEEFANAGVRYLTNYTTGPVQLICNQPVGTLDDLKDLKVRASGPYGDTLRSLGVEVVNMSQADVYQALDSGLIDCNQNYYYAMLAYRQYEVGSHVLELDWGQNMSFGIVMNANAYDGLSAEQREVLTQVSSDFVDHLAEAMIEADETAKAAMVDGIDGDAITVTELPEADRERLMAASAEVVDAWSAAAGEDDVDGEALLSDLRGRVETYRDAQDASGYPWNR